MKRRSYLLLFVLLFLLASFNGSTMANAPEVGDKVSGSYTYETEYIDPTGDEHTGKYSTMISMEIVEIYEKAIAKAPERADKVLGLNTYETTTAEATGIINGIDITFYRMYGTMKTDKIVSTDVREGRWTYQEIEVNTESTGYSTFHEPFEDYSPDTIDILNGDSLVVDENEWYYDGDGTIRQPFPRLSLGYYQFSFNGLGLGVHDPEDYLEEYEDEANDIFDDFEEVDWSYDYIDGVTGEHRTLDETAELDDSFVELDDLTLKIKYTITSTRDRYTFDRGIHNKPNEIDYEFSLTQTYSDNGLLQSFSSVEVYNAGDNGKVTYKNSFEADNGAGGTVTDFGFGWATILLIIGIVTIFRRIKTKK